MTRRSSTPGRDAYEQAATWFVRVSGGALDRSEQVAFERWYADAGNAAAYASVERSWQVAGAVGPQAGAIEDERLGGMIAAARQAGAPRRRRPAWRSIAAAALLVVVGGVLWWQGAEIARPLQEDAPVVAASSPESYVTAVGERSTITLGDGSQVSLNTDSRLRVSFTADRRQVALLAGQALFEVAPDSARPFEVAAAGHRVVALGTAFDVRVEDRGLQVTLIEGSVSVATATPAGNGAPATRLDPGQQFRVAGRQAPEVRSARVEQVTSWREGRLIFSDEPLARAVAEVNRYSTRKVRLGGGDLATLRVSGVFRTGRPDSFVAALSSYFPIEVESDPDGDIVLRPAGV